ncbi:hypothetical protein BC567DRAFT_213094 [Phyllosticta citribraziliensis]
MGLSCVLACASVLMSCWRKTQAGAREDGHVVRNQAHGSLRNAPVKYKYRDCRSRFLRRQPSPIKTGSSMAVLDQDVKVVDFAPEDTQLNLAPTPLHLPAATFLRTTALARHSPSSQVVAAAKELESRVLLPNYDADSLMIVRQVDINLWKFVRSHAEAQFCKLGHRLSMSGSVITAFDGHEYTSAQLRERCGFLKGEYEWRESQLAKFPPGPGKEHRLVVMASIKRQYVRYRSDFTTRFGWDVAPLEL